MGQKSILSSIDKNWKGIDLKPQELAVYRQFSQAYAAVFRPNTSSQFSACLDLDRSYLWHFTHLLATNSIEFEMNLQ